MKTKVLTLFAGVLVVLLAAIYVIFFVGSQIFYDFSVRLPFTKSKIITPNAIIDSATGSATASNDIKLYASSLGFQISYPKNWGLLTCSNSHNFELDPTNATDMLDVLCDYAMKPISVVISNDINGCEGENFKIGNTDVVKSQITTQNYTTYQWCTLAQPSLIISNRTSSTTNSAATNKNYSAEVETMIKSLQFTSR